MPEASTCLLRVFRQMCSCHLSHGDTLTIMAVHVCVFSSDRMGAYIHGLSINPAEIATGDGLLSGDKMVRPGSVPHVSHRAGAYGRLLVATYERMMAGSLSVCDWLTTVTQGAWRVALQSIRG